MILKDFPLTHVPYGLWFNETNWSIWMHQTSAPFAPATEVPKLSLHAKGVLSFTGSLAKYHQQQIACCNELDGHFLPKLV